MEPVPAVPFGPVHGPEAEGQVPVTVPLRLAQPTDSLRPARNLRLFGTPVASAGVPPPSILYVDDELHVRDFVAAMLPQHGLVVHLADHGLEALRILRRERVDVLVADLNLALLDGRRLALRAWALVPDLPVVFVSGAAGGPRCLPLRSGVQTAFLVKPFFTRELLAAIARVRRDLCCPPAATVARRATS